MGVVDTRAVNVMAKRKTNEEIKSAICEAIASGDSLVKILRESGMPGYRTVMTWLSEDETFQQNYARAREDQGDAYADRIDDVADRVLTGEIDPQAARVAIDALKWSAGKRLPKKYGDKLGLDVNGSIKIERVDVKFVEGEE